VISDAEIPSNTLVLACYPHTFFFIGKFDKIILWMIAICYSDPPCFFIGEFSPNFDLKDMISTYTKGFFSFKKWKKFAIFFKEKIIMISSST
jgi:hypothetical protein